MRTFQTGAVVAALLAIANADDTAWQAIFTVASGVWIYLLAREEARADR